MIVDFGASLAAWRKCKPLGWKDGARSWGSFPNFLTFSTPSKSGVKSICPPQTGGRLGSCFHLSIYIYIKECMQQNWFSASMSSFCDVGCRSLRWKSSSLLFASGNDVGPSALDESNPVCPCVRRQYQVDSVGPVSHWFHVSADT